MKVLECSSLGDRRFSAWFAEVAVSEGPRDRSYASGYCCAVVAFSLQTVDMRAW